MVIGDESAARGFFGECYFAPMARAAVFEPTDSLGFSTVTLIHDAGGNKVADML